MVQRWILSDIPWMVKDPEAILPGKWGDGFKLPRWCRLGVTWWHAFGGSWGGGSMCAEIGGEE